MPVSFYPVAAFFPKSMKDSFYERFHEVSKTNKDKQGGRESQNARILSERTY